MDRRAFLGMMTATAGALAAGRQAALAAVVSAGGEGEAIYFAALKSQETSRYGIGMLADGGGAGWVSEVEARLHGGAVRPGTPELAVIGRRPGKIAVVVDARDGSLIKMLPARPDRFYLGHACFDPSGERLFVSEADAETAAGMIGVYDAAGGYRRIAEWATGGTDPHEILLAAEGRSLWVANGGMELHPDTGRAVVNEGPITSSLVGVDLDGHLCRSVVLPRDFATLSLRHIALSATGDVVIGCQEQGDPEAGLPLVWRAGMDGAVRPLGDREVAWTGLKGYIGSVAVDTSGTTALVTSPRGNRAVALALDRPDASPSVLEAFDIGGVASLAEPGRFLVTTGAGVSMEVARGADGALIVETRSSTPVQWDNHIIRGSVRQT